MEAEKLVYGLGLAPSSSMPPVVAVLEYTPVDGPVVLRIRFTSNAGSVTVSAPTWRLEGERAGTPCSDHPPVVQAAVDKLARLAVDPNAAAEMFRIVEGAARTIAGLSEDDPAFIWPALVEHNTT